MELNDRQQTQSYFYLTGKGLEEKDLETLSLTMKGKGAKLFWNEKETSNSMTVYRGVREQKKVRRSGSG